MDTRQSLNEFIKPYINGNQVIHNSPAFITPLNQLKTQCLIEAKQALLEIKNTDASKIEFPSQEMRQDVLCIQKHLSPMLEAIDQCLLDKFYKDFDSVYFRLNPHVAHLLMPESKQDDEKKSIQKVNRILSGRAQVLYAKPIGEPELKSLDIKLLTMHLLYVSHLAPGEPKNTLIKRVVDIIISKVAILKKDNHTLDDHNELMRCFNLMSKLLNPHDKAIAGMLRLIHMKINEFRFFMDSKKRLELLEYINDHWKKKKTPRPINSIFAPKEFSLGVLTDRLAIELGISDRVPAASRNELENGQKYKLIKMA